MTSVALTATATTQESLTAPMGSAAPPMPKKTINVLFVCQGNICRSPALKGIFEALLKKKGLEGYVESCGLHGAFLGNPPDRRMQEVAKSHGITLDNRAKMFEASFFDQFDAIFCVTKEVFKGVSAMAHSLEHQKKLFLVTHFSNKYKDQEIPDPYFGGEKGFERIWEMMVDSCYGILESFL